MTRESGPLAILALAVLVVAAGLFALFSLYGGSETEPEPPPPQVVAAPDADPQAFKTAPWTPGVDPHLPHMLVVGVDIEPGTYTTQGELSMTAYQGGCTWARLSGLSGRTSEVIASGATRGPLTVTILPTDKGFVTGGCREWVGPS